MKYSVNSGDGLAAALAAEHGVVCLVGAGGKKSTMYALAAQHSGRVALSSTAHMYRYDPDAVDQVIVDDVTAVIDARARVVAYAYRTDTANRVGGLDAAALAAINASGEFDLMLIKADGARARLIKAPADYEPLIPDFADTVIPVVSARVFGRTLGEGIAHRPELAARVMETTLDAPLTPIHIARLLSAADGALKGVGDARVVPLINMVDDEAARVLAVAAARAALAATGRFDRVVLATMRERRVVEVIERR